MDEEGFPIDQKQEYVNSTEDLTLKRRHRKTVCVKKKWREDLLP